MNSDTGNWDDSYLLARVNVREDEGTPQIQVNDIKYSSFLFKRHELRNSDVTVLSDIKYLVHDMVIQDWHLMRKLHNLDAYHGCTIRVPFQIGQLGLVVVGNG